MTRCLTLLAGLATLLVAVTSAHPQPVKHRRPFAENISLGYGYDNNGSAAGCLNYACGTGTCYHTHSGSDFPLPLGTNVLAGAPGTVIATVQGCADWGFLGNTCGGRCGNYVKLQHADGSTTIYCHMKNGSLTVSNGQQVTCGQKLGQSASSGSSTGPHLHFGWSSGSTRDPFTGNCATGGGWVSQGSFPGRPSTTCQVQCQCTAGQTQSQDCGRCGTRTRSCNSACQWGSWSSCGGQGPCQVNASETRDCCDCGSQTRTCNNQCEWRPWGACSGPDPAGGNQACDTGEPGECAAGVRRCDAGCLTCEQTVAPVAELCDGLDNDCDAEVDEGATSLGASVPALAAALEDFSAPSALRPGETTLAWARFRNVGTSAWAPGTAWLVASAGDADVSPLWASGQWAAYDTAAVNSVVIEPGQLVTLTFPVTLAPGSGVAETAFHLQVGGTSLRCPAPDLLLKVERLASQD